MGILNVYKYWSSRTKTKPTQNTLKEELQQQKPYCAICGIHNILEMDHKIPVMIGGSLVDKQNLWLLCSACHLTKTVIDRRIIRAMKSLGMIWGTRGDMSSVCSVDERRRYYEEFYEVVIRYNKWRQGKRGIDYQQIQNGKIYK